MAGKPGHRGWGWIRRLPSGNFQASYMHHGRRHAASTTFSARTAAEGWLARERRTVEADLIGAGTWTPPKTRETTAKASQVTLGEYRRQWIAEHQCKPRTRREYENLFDGLIEPALGTVVLRELTPAMVRSWPAALARRRPRRGPPRPPSCCV